MKISEVIKNIVDNRDKILLNLDKESIDVYIFLKKEYEKGNINNNKVFQFVFRSFYRLDNAGLSDEQKIHFFELMSNKDISLNKILLDLYNFPTKRNKNSLQLSFATKLLHTIDNQRPIFDAEVTAVMGYKLPQGSEIDIRIVKSEKLYMDLFQLYNELLSQKEIENVVRLFREKFNVQENDVSNEKALDFIIWSLGKIMKKKIGDSHLRPLII